MPDPILKRIVNGGEAAGKLDAAFEKIADLSADAIAAYLPAFQQVFFRAVMASVMFSVGMTLLSFVG